MNFLRMLEGLRTPALDAFFSAITYLGDELFFMVLAITVFWCVSKRGGYYILLVGFLGTICNQFMKLAFRVPRPWVLDPAFTIVESARAGATGYSFPSGHTQNLVGTMSCLFLTTKRKWLRAAAVALMLLVPFSRMYLGCHTPLDVGVAFVMAVGFALLLLPAMKKFDEDPRVLRRLLAVMLAVALLFWAYVTFWRFPADIDRENLAHGIKNAYTLLGCLIGLLAARAIDERFTRFDVKAVWWAQILKFVLGLALTLAILKLPVKHFVLGGLPIGHFFEYFLAMGFASIVWPMTFGFFSRLGGRK